MRKSESFKTIVADVVTDVLFFAILSSKKEKSPSYIELGLIYL